MIYTIRHKIKPYKGRLIRTDGRVALVKWDNQSSALLIRLDEIERYPVDNENDDPYRYFNGVTFKDDV